MHKHKVRPAAKVAFFLAALVFACGLFLRLARPEQKVDTLQYAFIGFIIILVGNVIELRSRLNELERTVEGMCDNKGKDVGSAREP